MSAILAALKAFVVGTVPLNVAIKVASATLMVVVFHSGMVCGIKSVCIFVPNTTRYFEGTLLPRIFCSLGRRGKTS